MRIQKFDNINFNAQLSLEQAIKLAKKNPKTYAITIDRHTKSCCKRTTYNAKGEWFQTHRRYKNNSKTYVPNSITSFEDGTYLIIKDDAAKAVKFDNMPEMIKYFRDILNNI